VLIDDEMWQFDRLRKAFCVEVGRLLGPVHPESKISLPALSIVCDLLSHLLHRFLCELTVVAADNSTNIFVMEELRICDTMNHPDRFESVLIAKMAPANADPVAAIAYVPVWNTFCVGFT
jgi:hypothetical protein